MKATIAIFVAVAALLSFAIMPVLAQQGPPPLPHAFYGTVQINGQAAPAGTQVEARGQNVRTGIAGNPITTVQAGKYGGPTLDEGKLVVQGNIADGTTISFYINNVPAGQTFAFLSGQRTELALTVSISFPSVTLNAIASPTNDPTPTFTGMASSTQNNIALVEYQLDGGSWTAATASDGSFNTVSESFTFTTSSLADGSHTVWARATAGGQTTPEANYARQTFTVDTVAPRVVSSVPANGAANVSINASARAIFSEDISLTNLNFTLDSVAGDVIYNKGDFSATFVLKPGSSLKPNTAYTARVSAQDLAGNPMSQAYTWSFTTGGGGTTPDTTPPSIRSTSPTQGASNVALDIAITAKFSEAINKATLNFTIAGVAGSISYDESGLTAKFMPKAKLNLSTTYSASISAKDSAGNAMSKPYTWSFTTTAASPPPPSSPIINWALIKDMIRSHSTLIVGIIAAIILIVLIVVLVRRRRA